MKCHMSMFSLIFSWASTSPAPFSVSPPLINDGNVGAECGCLDEDSIEQRDVVAWKVFHNGYSQDKLRDSCFRFCPGEAAFFTLTPWAAVSTKDGDSDRTFCRCFNKLTHFDCDEEEGATLIKVYCTVSKQRQVPVMHRDFMSSVRAMTDTDDARRNLDAVEEVDGDTTTEDDFNYYYQSSSSSSSTSVSMHQDPEKKEEALALTAIVLGLLAFVCLILLAAKTYVDARREQKKAKIADKIAAAARATTAIMDGGYSNNAYTRDVTSSSLSSSASLATKPARLLSLSAGPFVYEKE